MTPLTKHRKPQASNLFSQLSIFDQIGLQMATQTAASELFSPHNIALGGLLDAIPSTKNYFHIRPSTILVPPGTKGKITANLNAIKTAKAIKAEGRKATSAEQAAMVKYTGWGGLSNFWDRAAYIAVEFAAELNKPVDSYYEGWAKKYGASRLEIDSYLSAQEIEEAAESTVNAFYTSRVVCNAIWKAIAGFGFTGGNILEPAAGIGHFVGLMPDSIREQSTITAVEKDTLSAEILAGLYPEITVMNAPFEDCELENGTFDLVVGNVPFGDFKVYDPKNRDLSDYNIHNYFIGRSARMLRPSGIMALITSAGTMDTQSKIFRQQLTNEGVELAGAIRLPSNAFEECAGTEVTTDILFFQKKTENSRRFSQHTFLQTVTVRTIEPDDEEADVQVIRINEYFSTRPEMMIGDMCLSGEVGKGGLYRDDRQTLFLAKDNDFVSLLSTAVNELPTAIFETLTRTVLARCVNKAISRIAAFSGEVRCKGRSFIQSVVIGEYDQLKDTYRQLLDAERTGLADDITEPLRENLNRQYDRFVNVFGPLTRNRSLQFLEQWDGQFSSVQALELVERESNTNKVRITKSGILTGRVYPLNPIPDTVETVDDALRLSMYIKGGIDLPYMAEKLRGNTSDIENELVRQELAYRDPITKKLVDKRSYLSGNVRQKLQQAQAATMEHPSFAGNVQALEKVIPQSIPLMLISFQLGSVWLPTDIIEDFIVKTVEVKATVVYVVDAAEYKFDYVNKQAVKNRALGTPARRATELIEAALNGRSIVITKKVMVMGESKEVKDVEATSQAVQAQEALQEQFNEFVRDNYAERIEQIFNDRFNGYVIKQYDKPAVAHYPGANPDVFLRDHQFRGVERIKDQDTMTAHEVGSGKTYTIITGAMELKRLGYINKAAIAVQNSTVDDFGNAWKKLYPSALIYVPEKADLEAGNRARFLQRIAANNFDGIVLPMSFLKLIPDDPIDAEGLIREDLERHEALLSHCASSGGENKKTVKAINKAKLAIKAKRKEQADRKKDNILHFGELGIDFLGLDECHHYKRVGFQTHRRGIKGVDTQGSQNALQALTKCRTVQRKGGRVVLATGTPISNTMAEAWTMLRFIAVERLNELSLSTFDQFAGTFGQVIPSFELTTSGQFKCVDRFAKFVNIGQLSELYRSYVDVVLNEDITEFKRDNTLPVLLNDCFTSHTIPQTDGVAEELYRIREELKRFEAMTGDEKKENCHIPLVMYGQAKKATLDIRLLRVDSPDEADSKVNVAIGEIIRVYNQTADYKGTQLVFSDNFQSPATTEQYLDEDGYIANPNFGKPRFNMFEDIRAKLIAYGLDPSEVAIVPVDAKKREPVFARLRTGALRVLLGTSERMGVGVNVQDRLAAAHHLDAPNRPTDFQQRNGRLIRQGNLHATWGIPVEVITYGVTRTLDATSYGRLAMKQKFINQVLKGTLDTDVIGDLGGDDDFAAMSFDQMMATLSGSQYALLYTAKNHELTRLLQQRKNWQRGLIDAQTYVEKASRQIELYASRMAQYGLEAEVIKNRFPEQSITEVEVEGELYTEGWMGHVERYTLDLKARARRGAVATGTIKLNGLTIGLKGVMVDTSVEGRGIYGIDYSWGLTLHTAVLNAPGLFVSLRTGLKRVLDAPAEAEQWLAYNEKVVKEFSLKLNQPFKGEGLIESLTAEVAELKLLMEQDSNQELAVSETALEIAMA